MLVIRAGAVSIYVLTPAEIGRRTTGEETKLEGGVKKQLESKSAKEKVVPIPTDKR